MAVTIDGTTGITTPGLTNTGTETLVDLTTTGNTTIGNVTTDTLVVGVNGIVKDTFGNVGIGTASPSYKLDVYGITRLGTNLSQGNANATDLFANTTLLVSGSGGNYLAFGQSTTGPQAQWIQSAYLNPTTAIYPIALQPLGGNVGIGTYTPGQPLTVSKNYNGATWVQVINTTSGTGASAGLVMTSDASIQAAIELTSSTFNVIPNMLRVRQIGAYPIGFFTTDTERMRIDASGNLGIGETSPVTYANGLTITDTAAQPEISLRTNTTLSSTSALKLGVTSSIPQGGAVISSIVTSAIGQYTDMIFSTLANGSLTAKMRLDANGNFGIGTASPSGKFHVAGTNNSLFTSAAGTSYVNLGNADGVTNTKYTYIAGASGYLLFGRVTDDLATRTETMRIDSSGNLGLGVTPSAWSSGIKALELQNGGSIYNNGTNDLRIGNNIYINSSVANVYKANGYATWYEQVLGTHVWQTAANNVSGSGASLTPILAMTLDASSNLRLNPAGGTVGFFAGPTSAEAYFQYNSDGSTSIGTRSGYATKFLNGATQVMTLDSAGNLGINEPSPVTYANGLTVTDTAVQPEISLRTNTTLSSTSALKLGVTSSIPQGGAVISSIVTSAIGQYTDMIFSTLANGSLTAKMRLDANGNFGIGTASPSGKFHVAGTNNSLFTSAAGTSYVNLGNADGVTNTKYTYIAGASGYLLFGRVTDDLATRTETMRIDSSGNVGIGTQSPGVKLDVVGTMRANTSVVAGNSSFGITINQNSLTLAGANSNFIFTKPVPTISNSSRFDFNTGSLNTGILAGPWWNGVHFNAQDVITNASAANEFPRTSHYYSYSTVTNPTDLNYNIVTGNSTVPQHMTIGTATSANIKFLIANAEAMRIDSAGSVGIGIGALSFSTQVTPSLTMYGGNTGLCLRNATTGTGNNVGTDIFLGTNGDLNIDQRSAQAIYIQTTATTRMAITASGDVGINTTTPSKKFEVYTAANSLQIASIVRNENTGTGVAAIGFNVSAAAGSDASVTKAGIGLVRSSTFGRGVLTFYNDNSAANNDFTTANAVMSIDATGIAYVGGTSTQTGATGTIYSRTTARAYANFGANTSATVVRDSFNCSSITYSAAGKFAVAFSSALVDANYTCKGSCASDGQGFFAGTSFHSLQSVVVPPTSSGFTMFTSVSGVNGGFNPTYVFFTVYR